MLRITTAVSGQACDDTAGRLDAVHIGHRDIHHHHVWTLLLGQPDAIPAVRRLAHHGHIGLPLEQRAQSVAHHRVIVSQQYANGHGMLPFDAAQFDHRQFGADHRSPAGFGIDLDLTAKAADALFHAKNSQAADEAGIEAGAVVPYAEKHLVAVPRAPPLRSSGRWHAAPSC